MRHNPGYGIMRELMQSGPVKRRGISEGLLGRKVDPVLAAIVKGTVGLIVNYLRAGILQNILPGLYHFEVRMLLRKIDRDAIDLPSIEDGVHAMNQPHLSIVRVLNANTLLITARI